MSAQNTDDATDEVTPRLSSLLRDERGAAYTEAVIMLPVFMTVMALFFMVYRVYTKKFETMSNVRSVAWTAANSDSCEDGGTEECPSGGSGCTTSDEEDDVQGGIDDLLGEATEIPVLGTLLDGVFGVAITKTVTDSVENPDYLGGGTKSVATSYTLMCNPEPTTVWELILDSFNDIIGDIF